MLKFLLNQKEVFLPGHAADLTVLDYLRQVEGLQGTKEGCASGDCGACTVVVAALADGGLSYRSVNSCIAFLGSLHGKQLITVDHLKNGDDLHPVQQAMVDCHGSQCGFCTPGFVMSMFALSKHFAAVKDGCDLHEAGRLELIHEFLAGNLCRCTGYRPIVEAANESCFTGSDDQFSSRVQHTVAGLQKIASETDADTCFFRPATIEQLNALMQRHPDARLLAGGTDLALEVTQNLQSIPKMVLLDRVAELQQVTVVGSHVEIGAAVSLQTCKELFYRHFPPIHDLLLRFGSRQIRNQGTIGGNLANASPIGDLAPSLLALNATLLLQCGEHVREIALDEFFIGYRKTALADGEFLRAVHIPELTSGEEYRVYKVSKRLDDDISAVCLAIRVRFNHRRQVDDVRVALGGMAAIPKRALCAEQALLGKKLDEQSLQAAMCAMDKDFSPVSDARASAAYRSRVAKNLLRRFQISCQNPHTPVQVEHDG